MIDAALRPADVGVADVSIVIGVLSRADAELLAEGLTHAFLTPLEALPAGVTIVMGGEDAARQPVGGPVEPRDTVSL
jgi:hypothetical protein